MADRALERLSPQGQQSVQKIQESTEQLFKTMVPTSSFAMPKVQQEAKTGLEEFQPLLQARARSALEGNQGQVDKIEDQIQTLFDDARKRKGLSTGEKIALGTIFTLTPLIGGLISGARGAAVGAKAGTAASLGLLKDIGEERESVREATVKQAGQLGQRLRATEAQEAGIDKLAVQTLFPKQTISARRFQALQVTGDDGKPFLVRFDRGGEFEPTPITADGKLLRPFRSPQGFFEKDTGIRFIFNPSTQQTDAILPDGRRVNAEKAIEIIRQQSPQSVQDVPDPTAGPPAPGAAPQAEPEAGFKLLPFPGINETIGPIRAEEIGVAGVINKEILKTRAERDRLIQSTSIEAGLTPEAKKQRLAAIDKNLSELEKEQADETKIILSNIQKGREAQARSRNMTSQLAEISGLSEEVLTGPVDNFFGSIAIKFEGAGLTERARLQSEVVDLMSQFLKDRSGLAVTEEEFIRLKKVAPQTDDTDEVFTAKLRQFGRQLERARREKLEATGVFGAVEEANIPRSALEAPSRLQELREEKARRLRERGAP